MAGGGLFEPGEHFQQGAFATPRRAQERDELAAFDRQFHAAQGMGAIAVGFFHLIGEQRGVHTDGVRQGLRLDVGLG